MALDLARWQFAFTTVNHFFFIPITIGLAFLTALLQTSWHRSGRPEYLRLALAIMVLAVAARMALGLGWRPAELYTVELW